MEDMHRRYEHEFQMPCVSHDISCEADIETATELNELQRCDERLHGHADFPRIEHGQEVIEIHYGMNK